LDRTELLDCLVVQQLEADADVCCVEVDLRDVEKSERIAVSPIIGAFERLVDSRVVEDHRVARGAFDVAVELQHRQRVDLLRLFRIFHYRSRFDKDVPVVLRHVLQSQHPAALGYLEPTPAVKFQLGQNRCFDWVKLEQASVASSWMSLESG